MAHVPHVFVPGPWARPVITLPSDTRHHLERVVRRRSGDVVTYTDGAGTSGQGTLGRGELTRGEERTTKAPRPVVTVAVAPPHSTDRVRFIVEKLGELGVDRLAWLDTVHGSGRAPHPGKARAWAVAALQQSGGDRLLDITGPVLPSGPWPEGSVVLAADPAGPAWRGGELPGGDPVVLIGPEGGFGPGEVPAGSTVVSFGPRVLRVETAAIVAATLLCVARA